MTVRMRSSKRRFDGERQAGRQEGAGQRDDPPLRPQGARNWVLGTEYEVVPIREKDGVVDLSGLVIGDDVGGLIVQSPNRYGFVEDYSVSGSLHERKALFAISSDPLSLAIQRLPASGSGHRRRRYPKSGSQSFFWRPVLRLHGGETAAAQKNSGRLVGITTDAEGRRAHSDPQAREQHIKRERATSNICSNQALAATVTTIHLSLGWHGMVKRPGNPTPKRTTWLIISVSFGVE